jgi:predicted ferric reductase
MTPIRIALITTLALLTGLWILAEYLAPGSYRSLHPFFTQYTGAMGLAMMSLALVLATRPKWLERPLHGLDKMYRLHKWLGITGLVFMLAHWWWTPGEQLRLRRGWAETTPEGIQAWFQGQEAIAESIGVWTFYAILVLIILALLRWFPYHLFHKIHKLLAVAYLPIVYHSVVLIRFEYWLHPAGLVMAALMIAGTGAAAIILTGRIGISRKVQGTIRSLTFYPKLYVIEGEVELKGDWPGHKPGQFAFVTDERHEGAHPYTIASDWVPEERCLVFIVKELGDYTNQLPRKLKKGMPVTVEGPYGCFDFEDNQPRQIWVAGGIGITPFVARMKYLAHHPGERQPIDLFFTTDEYEQDAADKLIADADSAGVRLHLYFTPRDGFLTGEAIRSAVAEWRKASIWFCGPTAFGKAVKRDLVSNGLSRADFHQELFRMR